MHSRKIAPMKPSRSANESLHRDVPPTLGELAVVPVVGHARGQLLSPVDGRNGSMDPGELQRAVKWLAGECALEGVKYALGIPEGGYVPAYAFAAETGLRVVLATRWEPDVPGVITFVEEHIARAHAGKHILGLSAGDHVIVIEDEVTSGRTVINCVRALRAAGIRCDQVATIYAADDQAMRARFIAEGICLHAVSLFQSSTSEALYRGSSAIDA
jgi:adenine/guanine phosphoribosyltransferase-like PRPP-binding protein